MTVTVSAPFLYQQVSIALDDSMPVMLMDGFPTFFSRSARSMPNASAVKSAGTAGGAGGAGAAAGTAFAVTTVGDGAAGEGLGASLAAAAPASEPLTLLNIVVA